MVPSSKSNNPRSYSVFLLRFWKTPACIRINTPPWWQVNRPEPQESSGRGFALTGITTEQGERPRDPVYMPSVSFHLSVSPSVSASPPYHLSLASYPCFLSLWLHPCFYVPLIHLSPSTSLPSNDNVYLIYHLSHTHLSSIPLSIYLPTDHPTIHGLSIDLCMSIIHNLVIYPPIIYPSSTWAHQHTQAAVTLFSPHTLTCLCDHAPAFTPKFMSYSSPQALYAPVTQKDWKFPEYTTLPHTSAFPYGFRGPRMILAPNFSS